jgi:hypothetical protein
MSARKRLPGNTNTGELRVLRMFIDERPLAPIANELPAIPIQIHYDLDFYAFVTQWQSLPPDQADKFRTALSDAVAKSKPK